MIKLFASDLDGTLFNAFHNVDRTILDAARAIVATGAHLVLATGRTVISARDLGFEDVPIEAVGSNGSIIRDGAGEIIKTFPLDPAELEDLMRSFPHVCFDAWRQRVLISRAPARTMRRDSAATVWCDAS